MKRAFFPSLLLLYIIGINQSFAQVKLDDYFDNFFNKQKFMGSVAISHNDSIIYSKSVGYADVQNNLRTNSDTKFRIGSLTKTFTAALVLKAIEESKLKLGDLLSYYYPH
jgi:CubicO group peptidase (beta-lactamase class C family)